MPSQNTPELRQQIEDAANQVIALRSKPLLIMYYPGSLGYMGPQDVEDCYQVFRNANITPESPLEECDVLIHTFGGDPVTGYRLGQCLHDFAKSILFLIPKYSYSAGTLLCFSGNRLYFGHSAGVSPIDVTRVPVVFTPREEEVELASIDSFLDFAEESQKRVQQILHDFGLSVTSEVCSDLLCALVGKVGPLKVAQYYRERTLTGQYAQELLDRYMLDGLPNAEGRRDTIIGRLLFGSPSHDFHLDFHMSADLGLEVEEMSSLESDATRGVVALLDDLTRRKVICLNVTNEVKMPFIALYLPNMPATSSGGRANDS
jgi:hypothetical protein